MVRFHRKAVYIFLALGVSWYVLFVSTAQACVG